EPVAGAVGVVVVGVDGADDGEGVGRGGGARQQLAEVDDGNGGADWLEGAADFGGGVGLGVEGFVLRRAAGQPEEDDVLGAAEGRVGGGGAGVGGGEELRQADAE